MTRALTRFLCLLALLAVALYGAAAGAMVARGPAMEMVICSEGGIATVLLDAKGDPVDSSDCFHCPDCLVLAFGLPAAPGPDAGPGRLARAPDPPSPLVPRPPGCAGPSA